MERLATVGWAVAVALAVFLVLERLDKNRLYGVVDRTNTNNHELLSLTLSTIRRELCLIEAPDAAAIPDVAYAAVVEEDAGDAGPGRD